MKAGLLSVHIVLCGHLAALVARTFGGYIPGQEIFDLAHGILGDSFEHVLEIDLGV